MWADRYNNVLEGARRGRPPNDRPADVLDAIYSSVACEREGTRERCTRSVLVLQLRGRPHASMLCHLPDGPSLRGGLGGWPRDLPAPHLLYLAWKKRAVNCRADLPCLQLARMAIEVTLCSPQGDENLARAVAHAACQFGLTGFW